MANNVFPPRPPFPPAPPRGRSVPPPPPGVMQYIGARYVPFFADPIEWQPNKLYEPLTIVTYNNSSYTSKQTVPAGISPDNGEYWVETGNFNAQINDLSTKIDGWDEEIAANTQTANEAKATADAAQQAVSDLDLSGLQQSVTDAIQKVDDLEPLVQENTDNIATNTAAIADNKTDIQTNATDISNLKSADTALGNRVTACENNITTAQSDITQAQTDISQNTTNISANTSAIAGLTSGLSDANTDIQKNATDITALQTNVTKNTTDIGTANTNIANMQTQVDNVAGQIQTIKDQSDAATQEVERLTTIVGDDNSGLIKDFNNLKQAVESGESVEALAGRVGLLENQVGKPATDTEAATGLEKKIADNTSSIAANTTAIGNNAASLTALENQVGHEAEGENPATGLVKEIDDIKASIGTVTGDVGGRLDTLDSEVSSLKTTVGDATRGLVKDVDANMGDIAALQADVQEIQNQQTAQDTAISGNTTAIGNAVSRITAVETGKQDKITVDDSLNFSPSENPSNLSVKLPSVSLTQAEYAALETKEDKLYVITDSNESGSGTTGVQSFNGRSGAVTPQTGDYTADMVGAIPKTGGNLTGDLEFAVDGQTMGGLHAAQGKYLHLQQSHSSSNPGSALFFPISEHTSDEEWAIQIAGVDDPSFGHDAANKRYVDSSIVRQNLLDNAYFLNPVNQRGKNLYSLPNTRKLYTIDRWALNTSATLTINNDGIVFTTTDQPTFDIRFDYWLDNIKEYLGKILTVSFLVSSHTGSPYRVGIRCNTSSGSYVSATDTTSTGTGLVSCSVQIPNDANIEQILPRICFSGTADIGSSVKLSAAKVELGTFQTLAHKEGDTWVLNEIPDYATELLKCQRYFLYWNQGYLPVGMGIARPNACLLSVNLPVAMRTTPTISGNLLFRSGESFIAPTDIHIESISTNNIRFAVTGDFTTQLCYDSMTPADNFFALSAEL